MASSGSSTGQAEGTIVLYYVIEGHVLSTRSADAYKGADRRTGTPVLLWMLRHPLAPQSEAVQRFLDRMKRLEETDPLVCEMLAYGVDTAGVAFAVFPQVDGYSIVSGNIEPTEAERRFMWAMRLVDRLHKHGIVCGDLCGSSFWVDRGGDIRFIGVMGSFDTEAAATAMVPPVETMPYLSPEQRAGGTPVPSSDVFALGVLGYFLLTKNFPYGGTPQALAQQLDSTRVKPISAFINVPPVWSEDVLQKCLQPLGEERFENAGAILSAISDIRTNAFSHQKTPVAVGRSAPPSNINKGAQVIVPSSKHSQALASGGTAGRVETKAEPKRPPRFSNTKLGLIGVGALALAAGVYTIVLTRDSTPSSTQRQGELNLHVNASDNPQVAEAIKVISEADVEISEKLAQLEKLVNSDDPLAHQLLVTSARDAGSDKLRQASEQAVIDRARRLGMMRSAEQVRQWLRTVKRTQIPDYYEAVLKALDTTLPLEASGQALRQAYPSNSILALRLGAALALDTNKLVEYQPLMAQLVGDALKMDDASQHATLSLILADQQLALVFGDDVIQRREQIPDSDVLWLLKLLAERGDSSVRAMSSMALERGLLPSVRRIFVTTIRDRTDIDPTIMQALVRAAAGAIRSEDIAAFGRWYDVDSEKILYAVLAEQNDPVLAVEAFDTVAGKSLTLEPAGQLVSLVRSEYWERRGEFARALGIIAHVESATVDDLKHVFDVLSPISKNQKVLTSLVESGKPALVSGVVERYPDKLGLGVLLNLLESQDKSVRITAVRALKPYNDIGALKIIIDRYEREKDADVRTAYRDTFWVIKQREAGVQ